MLRYFHRVWHNGRKNTMEGKPKRNKPGQTWSAISQAQNVQGGFADGGKQIGVINEIWVQHGQKWALDVLVWSKSLLPFPPLSFPPLPSPPLLSFSLVVTRQPPLLSLAIHVTKFAGKATGQADQSGIYPSGCAFCRTPQTLGKTYLSKGDSPDYQSFCHPEALKLLSSPWAWAFKVIFHSDDYRQVDRQRKRGFKIGSHY